MRLKSFSWYFFLLLCLPFGLTSQVLTFQNLNYKDGLPVASISKIVTKPDGTIWIGTDGAGIFQYNGIDFKEVANTASQNHHVTSIFVNKNGETIFTSKYLGLYKIKNDELIKLSAPGIFKGEFQEVAAVNDKIIIGTTKGIYQYSNASVKNIKLFSKATKIHQLIPLKKGAIILTSSGNFLYDKKSEKISLLSTWLPKSKSIPQMCLGYEKEHSIFLFDSLLSKKTSIHFNEDNKVFSFDEENLKSTLSENEYIISVSNYKGNSPVFLSDKNRLFELKGKVVKEIMPNHNLGTSTFKSICKDYNGDLWIATSNKGIVKASNEPFTKLVYKPEFNSSEIFEIHKSKNNDIIFCTPNETFIANLEDENKPVYKFDFGSNAIEECEQFYWVGTRNGLKLIDKSTYKAQDLPYLKNEHINLIQLSGEHVFIGIYGKGLRKYDLKTKAQIKIDFPENSPNFYYTYQYSNILHKHYFGTNDGIIEIDEKTNKAKALEEANEIGFFIGNSTKDVYKTIWFTGDLGLIGILQNGEKVIVKDKKLFSSKLFYTLNSDDYGNLFVGTNKGINVLKVNEFGKILSSNNFSGKTGFGGYETNMRAQFQTDKEIYLGTVEGLFIINPKLLENFPKPTKPIIQVKNHISSGIQNGTFTINFVTNNPKIKHVFYSYRIIGKNDTWSELSSNSTLIETDLTNGNYIIEVISSYDGKIFSEVARKEISISVPFWKSKLLIILSIIILAIVNIFFIAKRKKTYIENYYRDNELQLELKMTPQILLFVFLATFTFSNMVPFIDNKIPNNVIINFLTSAIMLALYLYSRYYEKIENEKCFRKLLVVDYMVLASYIIYGIYDSNLHPYFIFIIAIITVISPYIFERFKYIIISSFVLVTLSILIYLTAENPIYNKTLFLITIFLSIFTSIFFSYLRKDSVEKLVFVSGIVNKGNAMVVVFDKNGIITYVSENISKFLNINHQDLIQKRISYLNNFLPKDNYFNNIHFSEAFVNDQKYIVPMLKSPEELLWIEWNCKIFTDNINVILGQDVSDRMEVERTYELLVESAEDFIYRVDVNGKLEFVNNSFCKAVGYSKEELIGQSSLNVVHPDFKEVVLDFYQSHFKDKKKSTYFEFPIVTKLGEVKWVGQHVSSQFSSTNLNHISGFLSLARDITSRLEHEKVIVEQNNNITSSITYAKRIQENLLPNETVFDDIFKEKFIINRPKDIVSGDFYWVHKTNDKTILALGDCTGHGVPGAFMTLLGINLLNNIVIENQYTEPALILNQLDKKLSHSLSSENANIINDGIELTVCAYDHKTGILSYACAGSKFLIYKNNEFNLYKGDVKHIGDNSIEDFREYYSHHVQIDSDDIIFLFTDGFQDQFGGLKDKRFSFRRLLETFEENIRLPLLDQKEFIEHEFEQWKSEAMQTDDVTIIAFKGFKNESL